MAGLNGFKYYYFYLSPGEHKDIEVMVGLVNIVETAGVINGVVSKQYGTLTSVHLGDYIKIGEDTSTALNVYNNPDSVNNSIRIKSNFKSTLYVRVQVFGY